MKLDKNYYQILGVNSQANVKQIRSAFRQRAKKLHPDVSTVESFTSIDNRQMHLLIKAYHILSNPDLRRDYDLTHGIDAHKFDFDFRDFLKKQTKDKKSLTRLVFHDLLRDHYDEALAVYEQYFDDELETSVSRASVRNHISFYFSYSDYMDCLFLLAEAYERKRQYLKAMHFYYNIARLESHKAIFGEFFSEVREAIRRIIRIWERSNHFQHIIRVVPFLFDVRSLKKERAFYEKKIIRYHNIYGSRIERMDRSVRAVLASIAQDQKQVSSSSNVRETEG